MSGPNTKASKINRVLNRQLSINDDIGDMFELIRIGHETDANTIDRLTNSLKLSVETNHRLEAENDRLRKYLGSVLFERRKMQAKTTGSRFCDCLGACEFMVRPVAGNAICDGSTYCKGLPAAQIPTLGPSFGNRNERKPGACSCEPGACRGYSYCRFAT